MLNNFIEQLKNNKQYTILSLLSIIVIFFVYVVIFKPILSGTNYEFIVDPFFTIVIVTIFMSLVGKFGMVLNAESLINTIQSNFGILATLIDGSQTSGLMGTDAEYNEYTHISKLKNGDRVFWLDTRISGQTDEGVSKLEEALRIGVSIRLLVMHPENTCMNARFEEIQTRGTYDEYVQEFGAQKTQLDGLKEEADKEKWDFEVEYYRDLPGLPILILRQGDHEEAYTGFYLNSVANDFARIRWQSAKESFLDQLQNYFDKKFQLSKQEKKPSIQKKK